MGSTEQRAFGSTRSARRLRRRCGPEAETADLFAAKRKAELEARRAASRRNRRLLAQYAALLPKSQELLATAKGTAGYQRGRQDPGAVAEEPAQGQSIGLVPLPPRPNLRRVGGALPAEDVIPLGSWRKKKTAIP